MKTARLALWLWYRGEGFAGFQRQVNAHTVQAELERALADLEWKSTPLPSGRTDKGVHARMQVVRLRIPADGDPLERAHALGARLGPNLGIAHFEVANPDFHAQWSAVGKEYRYRVRAPGGPKTWDGLAWDAHADERMEGFTPNLDLMPELLAEAEGTRDFFAFHENSSVRKPRTLNEARWHELAPGLFEARLVGTGFARYQVRFLVGTAIRVSSGRLSRDEWTRALEAGTELRGLRAPAAGLTLWEVRYPAALDPFSPELRAQAPGVPQSPPFAER